MKKLLRYFINAFGYDLIKTRDNKNLFWPLHRSIRLTAYESDQEFNQSYEKAQGKTQMADSDNPLRRQRHHTLTNLLRAASLDKGDVCELGCWRGLSAYQTASYLKKANFGGQFHIFDSFEGLSALEAVDLPGDRVQDIPSLRKEFSCTEEIVKNNLIEFDFISYYKGWIPDRFDEVDNNKFSFVHVDVDLYQPILDSFQFFYPRLERYGIMVFDDYGSAQFPGAKLAVDECLAQFNQPFFISLPSGTAFLIKGLES